MYISTLVGGAKQKNTDMGQSTSQFVSYGEFAERAAESLDALIWNEAVKIDSGSMQQVFDMHGVRNTDEMLCIREALARRQEAQTRRHEFFASKHDLNNAGVVALSNFHCRILFRYNLAMIYVNGYISIEQVVGGRTC